LVLRIRVGSLVLVAIPRTRLISLAFRPWLGRGRWGGDWLPARMQGTEFRWLAALDEVFGAVGGAGIDSEHAGLRIDLRGHDSVRLRKTVASQVRPDRERLFHECGPDWQGGFGSFEPEFRVVVESDPDYANHLRSVPGKPAVP